MISANVYDDQVIKAFEVVKQSVLELPQEHQQSLQQFTTTWEGFCDGKPREMLCEMKLRKPFVRAQKEAVEALAEQKYVVPVPVPGEPEDPVGRAHRDRIWNAKRAVHASGCAAQSWLYRNGKPAETHLYSMHVKRCLQLQFGAGPSGRCPHCKSNAVHEDLLIHYTWCPSTQAFRTIRHTELASYLRLMFHRAGFTALPEIVLQQQGEPEGKDDEPERKQDLRIDVVVSDHKGPPVCLDVSILSPLAQEYRNAKAPAAAREQRKRQRYEAACLQIGCVFKPLIVNVFGQLTPEGQQWFSTVASTWSLHQSPDGPRSFAHARARVFRLFHVGLKRTIGTFLNRCMQLKKSAFNPLLLQD